MISSGLVPVPREHSIDRRRSLAKVRDSPDRWRSKLFSGKLEARAGIEPAHKGFADLSLTTWVPRLGRAVFS